MNALINGTTRVLLITKCQLKIFVSGQKKHQKNVTVSLPNIKFIRSDLLDNVGYAAGVDKHGAYHRLLRCGGVRHLFTQQLVHNLSP